MPQAAEKENGGENVPDAEAVKKDEKPVKKEKKYEWIEVTKTKTRTKKTDLQITCIGGPGLSDSEVQKRMDEESAIQADMRDIIETDERKNDLESYIFNMRDKIAASGEYGAFISDADRDKFNSELTKAEDWVYDNFDATKVAFIDKLNELKVHGDPVVWRSKEESIRGEWITALTGTVKNYREAAVNPGDKYGHIASEKLAKIATACDEVEKWLSATQKKQESIAKCEKPVLICADMEKKNQELAKTADEILKEPKPAPPKEEKKEEAKPQEAKEAKEGAAPEAPPA